MSILLKNEIIEIIKQPRKSGGPRTVYKCKCLICDNITMIRKDYIKKSSGLCSSCSKLKSPFESIYNIFLKTAKRSNREVTITYEDFLIKERILRIIGMDIFN